MVHYIKIIVNVAYIYVVPLYQYKNEAYFSDYCAHAHIVNMA